MKPTYEDLQYEIVRLKALVAPNLTLAARMQIALRMTPRESAVLALLVERGQSSREIIYSLCFEYPNGDGPFAKIVDVYMCRIRKAFRDGGIPGTIKNVRAYGYSLTPPALDYLRARFVGDQAGALAA